MVDCIFSASYNDTNMLLTVKNKKNKTGIMERVLNKEKLYLQNEISRHQILFLGNFTIFQKNIHYITLLGYGYL